MALLKFWKNSREDVLTLTIDQIVSSAGNGKILDGSICSTELRTYLSECPADNLFAYAQDCLDKAFPSSGLVLQDIVNELGRRLDFEVESGIYRGKPSVIGFDGVWRAGNEPNLIIEVKTTDYVAMNLDTHAKYKEKLLAAGRIGKESSTLIIVGREDTGSLEAQIRGSRYAWEMRLISVDRLIKLVQIKEKSDDQATVDQIRRLLQPFEYTKIDRIIDVIFTTTQDVESQQVIETEAVEEVIEEQKEPGRQIRTKLEQLNAKRQEAVDAFAILKGSALIKRGTTFFTSPDKTLRVCCAVSKRYDSDYQPYWYAYHPAWNTFLSEGEDSYYVLCCMDRDEAFAIPYAWLKENHRNLNTTERGEKSYWHVPLTTLEDGTLAINMSRVGVKVPLTRYRFQIKSIAKA